MNKIETRLIDAHNNLPINSNQPQESHGNPQDFVEPILRLLREKLLLEISGGEKRVPKSDEIRDWILKLYANNPSVGDMARAILLIKEDLVIDEHRLPSIENSLRNISRLEKLHLPDFFFVSSELSEVPHGVLFERHKLNGGGLVFSATLFDKENLIKKVGRMEIRVCEEQPEPFLSILTPKDWLRISKHQISSSPIGSFVIQCLLQYKDYKYPSLPLESIITSNSIKRQKDNNYFVNLIKNAYLDKVICTRVTVPLDIIQPRDIDYALRVSDEKIRNFMPYAAHTEFLLYEENGALIMDDDYLPYLACKALRIKEIKAVILGKYNQPQAKVISTGNSELIPHISVSSRTQSPHRHVRDKQELLRQKLQLLQPTLHTTARMESKFIELCWLLNRIKTRERDLHNFLKENPQILDSHLAAIFSEVPIGKYRADLVLKYNQTDKRVMLIELEPHDKQIFTKRNRLRYHVTHALQQVEDWIGEIHRGAPNIPSWMQNSYTAECAIIIGRSKDLTEEQKETLALKNVKSSIKILTYDDLLERLSQLIKTLDKEQHFKQ